MPPHPGGVELVAQQLARWYSQAGHEVHWLATGPRAALDRDGSIERERVPAWNGFEAHFGMPFPIPGPNGWGRIARAAAAADVVHLHDCLYVPIVAADRAAHRAGVPILITQHVGMVAFGGAVDPLLNAAYRTIGRSVLRHAAKIAFVNEGVRAWFHEHIDAELVSEHVPNAVDTTRFRPPSAAERAAARAAFGIPLGVPVVLFVGRLVAKKNPGLVVDALRLVEQPWHALIVGDGPLRGVVAALGERVTHVPALQRGRMPEAYAAADAFILPSRDEGTPLSVLEALASGLAIVVSDDRAFSELEGCAGVRRVPAVAQPIADALRALLRDEQGERASKASRAWAESHYGEDRIAARYLAFVRELTGGAQPAPGASSR